MPIPTTEVTATGANIALSLTLQGDEQVQLIAFKRADDQLIGIVISYTSPKNGIEYEKIELISSPTKKIFIDDVVKLPQGTIIKVTTTGVTIGQVDAWVVTDNTLNRQ